MARKITPEILQQIARQCDVVCHLASVLSEVYSDYAKMERAGDGSPFIDIAEQLGNRTARHMEILGDILNGMDAIEEEDACVNPIFEKAQKLFPQDMHADQKAAATAERERCAKIAESEEELEGAPRFEMRADSIQVARAIVRATKKSIARRIRADLKDNSDDL